jgi:hypothetical protein
MRLTFFAAVAALAIGAASTCLACNGGGGTSSGTSTGSMGLTAFRSGGIETAFRSAGVSTTGSPFASTGSSALRQALLQQLAAQRMLQEQMQLVAQQPMLQDQSGQQPTLITQAERAQQARDARLAQRQARAAIVAERKAAAKARTLVKSQVKTPTDAAHLAADQ